MAKKLLLAAFVALGVAVMGSTVRADNNGLDSVLNQPAANWVNATLTKADTARDAKVAIEKSPLTGGVFGIRVAKLDSRSQFRNLSCNSFWI